MAPKQPNKSQNATKTPQKSPRLSNGGLLLTGNPGNKGGTGRPPDEFQRLCRQLASRDETFTVAKRILDDPESYPKLWTGALKWATENGYGKPKESVDHTVTGEVTVRFARETNKRTAS